MLSYYSGLRQHTTYLNLEQIPFHSKSRIIASMVSSDAIKSSTTMNLVVPTSSIPLNEEQ